MAETTKKKQTVEKKPATKVAKKAPAKAAVKSATKVAKKAPAKAAVKSATKVAKKAPAKAAVKPATKVAKKAPAKAAVKPATKVAKKAPAKAAVKPATKVAKKTPAKAVVKATKPSNKSIKKLDFLLKLSENLNFIKFNFLDVSQLYKNFIHWNISKIVIFVWSVILGLVAIIPFIGVLFAYSKIVDIDLMMLIDGSLSGNLMFDLIGYLLIFIIVAVFFISFSYSNVLLMKVNNSYLAGKKLSYKKNDYFEIKKIMKFLNLSLINISILLIPALLFLILMGILFFVSGSLENISQLVSGGMFNYFSILSLIFVVVSVLISVYLSYRVIFSYLIFSDNNEYNEKKTALSYVKESFNKTKNLKNFFKFIALFIIFSILLSPINYLGKVLEKNDKNLNNYNMFLNLSDEQKTSISGDDLYYVESLKLEYQDLTQDEINIEIKLNNMYTIVFTILDFIFLYGLFVMITSSFYRRELV